MKTTYRYIDEYGNFISFWREDEETITIYRPSSFDDNHNIVHYNINEWKENKKLLPGCDCDTNLYDEDINAACYFLDAEFSYSLRKPINKDSIVVSNAPLGVYCPRIWRGYYNHGMGYSPIPPHVYGSKFTESIVAYDSLHGYLADIFKYIEPSNENLSAYGHKTRELLILACTEIESGWCSVLKENSDNYNAGYHFKTSDYIKLKKPLRLEEWCLSMHKYPQLDKFIPFKNWEDKRPTKSLSWYDAYNSVKHDREVEFKRATLRCVLDSMAALHVMAISQWGPEIYGPFQQEKSPFMIEEAPSFVDEVYLPNLGGSQKFRPKKYFTD